MSTKFNISNVKYYSNSDITMVMGTMEANSSPPNSINIPPVVTKSAHVLLTRMGYDCFKTAVGTAPVTSNQIYCYDQLGNLVGRYEKNRQSNVGGSLSIVSEPVTLLSNMKFPDVPESDELIVTMASYTGLDQTSLASSRKYLLEADLKELAKNVDPSRIHLFITSSMSDVLKKIDYPLPFKVTVAENCTNEKALINYLVEYLCGRTISGHQAIFQGFVNFGDDFDIIGSKCHRKTDDTESSNMTLTTRRGGRIQVNVDGKNGVANFLVFLRKKKEDVVLSSINEEVTKTTYTASLSDEVNGETFSDITMLYLDNFINAIKYQEKLMSKTDTTSQLTYVKKASDESMRYLFGTDHVFTEELSSNEFSKLIVAEFGSVVMFIKNRLVQLTDSVPLPLPLPRGALQRHGAGNHLQAAYVVAASSLGPSSSLGGTYEVTPAAAPFARVGSSSGY